MKLATIIVNFNDIIDTKKYVNKISTYNNIDKILIVDNKSTQPQNAFELLKELKSKKVEVIQSEQNGGYSYGNNYGINYLKSKNEEYDYYAISNPDIEVSKEALQRCIDFLEKNNNVGIVAPKMVDSKGNPIRRSAWKERTLKRDYVHSSRILELLFFKVLRDGEYTEEEFKTPELEVDVISGAFFLIRKDVFDKINGFDENIFLFYEEDILSKELQKLGFKIYSLNDVTVTHYESRIIGKTFSYFRKVRELYKSKMYYHSTYTKITKRQELIFKFLYGIRVIELLVEVPVRKILKK